MGREPGVSRAGTIVPLDFEVLKKLSEKGRIECFDAQVGRRLSQVRRGKTQQQPEGVSVAPHRVWARISCPSRRP